jgi:hypothetical protein
VARTHVGQNKRRKKWEDQSKKSLIGSGSGKIQVTSYRLTGDAETSGDGAAYIVSQRSTRRFKVSVVDESDSSTTTAVLTLVDKAAGALAEGEFRISVVNPLDSSTDNASKLCNRTVVVGGIGADASAGSNKFKASISDTATNSQGGAAIGDEDFDATEVAALGIANIDSQ